MDLNGDGKLDVLYTNGDILDQPYLLKPYHGVQWLENRGPLPLRAPPPDADVRRPPRRGRRLRGGGRKDIVAVSFLPADGFPQRKARKLDAVVLLEQTAKGEVSRHVLETVTCDHFSCAAGDLYGDGRIHLVTGSFSFTEGDTQIPAITVWENTGKSRK